MYVWAIDPVYSCLNLIFLQVMFVEHDGNESRVGSEVKKYGGCQLAPGLILMHSDSAHIGNMDSGMSDMGSSQQSSHPSDSTQAIAKELLHDGTSSKLQ